MTITMATKWDKLDKDSDEQAALDKALDAALDDLDCADEIAANADESELPNGAASGTAIAAGSSPDKHAGSSGSYTNKDKSSNGNKSISSAEKKGKQVDAPFIGPPRPPPAPRLPAELILGSTPEEEKLFADMLTGLLGAADLLDGELDGSSAGKDGNIHSDEMMQKLMEQMQAQMKPPLPPTAGTKTNRKAAAATTATAANTTTVKTETKTKTKKILAPPDTRGTADGSSIGSANSTEVDTAILNLVEDLAKQASTDADENDKDTYPDGDAGDESRIINSLLQGLTGAGTGGLDADAVIDGMMEQLLSKELMYEPIQQVASRFPSWLEERRNYLSHKELKERSKQCEIYQKLAHCYETNPKDTKRLTALMQEVHEYGQPPPEIIKDVAPGLELDANGLPKFDSTGLPVFNGNEDECRIM